MSRDHTVHGTEHRSTTALEIGSAVKMEKNNVSGSFAAARSETLLQQPPTSHQPCCKGAGEHAAETSPEPVVSATTRAAEACPTSLTPYIRQVRHSARKRIPERVRIRTTSSKGEDVQRCRPDNYPIVSSPQALQLGFFIFRTDDTMYHNPRWHGCQVLPILRYPRQSASARQLCRHRRHVSFRKGAPYDNN